METPRIHRLCLSQLQQFPRISGGSIYSLLQLGMAWGCLAQIQSLATSICRQTCQRFHNLKQSEAPGFWALSFEAHAIFPNFFIVLVSMNDDLKRILHVAHDFGNSFKQALCCILVKPGRGCASKSPKCLAGMLRLSFGPCGCMRHKRFDLCPKRCFRGPAKSTKCGRLATLRLLGPFVIRRQFHAMYFAAIWLIYMHNAFQCFPRKADSTNP